MANKKQVNIEKMVKQLKKAEKFLELVQELKKQMDSFDEEENE
jgi:hypothetical protein